jgi:predicted esterase
MNLRAFSVPVFLALLFAGALFWARSHDAFERKWFTIRTSSLQRVKCVAVLPKPLRRCPVVVYLHGAGETLMLDGKELRQIAELGIAAVSFEYNQTNYMSFEEQFSSLLGALREQPWASSNSIAWVGYGLGAQNSLRFLLRHPAAQPKVLVRLSGGFVPELTSEDRDTTDQTKRAQNLRFQTAILLVQGERDTVYPASDAQDLAGILTAEGNLVSVKVLPGLGHTFDADHGLVIREMGEYVKAHVTPGTPSPEFPSAKPISFPYCVLPAFFWLGGCLCLYFRKNGWHLAWKRRNYYARWEIGLRLAAVVLAAWALTETGFHLVMPHLKVTRRTLEIARRMLIAPQCHQDFESLAGLPVWNGQKLQTLLTHVELANNTTHELIVWKTPPEIYQNFVLSPVIERNESELNWRRQLWEYSYPRIRQRKTTLAAAEVVARTLRERVTIWPKFDRPQGVETIWREQITGENGFERLYVATLRAVGVPARLDLNGKAEVWNDGKWQRAPQPISF